MPEIFWNVLIIIILLSFLFYSIWLIYNIIKAAIIRNWHNFLEYAFYLIIIILTIYFSILRESRYDFQNICGDINTDKSTIPEKTYDKYFIEAEICFDNGNYVRSAYLYREYFIGTRPTYGEAIKLKTKIAKNRMLASELLVMIK